ncbi:YkvA family protein [Arcicella sp. DC2W]|uniref:YkvA family protein n=1 Tax=Arcicella gelida TaxID=2984195 RepID=A0ABU5S9G2_9BACT|nr:YkvA family protein [Arcicella sp. DC2W]MEA5405113.1 YkvA family protein [Arcicella sp. DC2W]
MNNEDLVGRILKSVFFKSATKKAGKYAGTGLAVLELLREALIKAKNIAKNENKGIGQVLAERITTLSRMVKAYATGQYRIIPWASILKIIASLIYFISPIDLIPDFLPLVGLSDDLALVMWLFTSLKTDIDNFIAWEKGELIPE